MSVTARVIGAFRSATEISIIAAAGMLAPVASAALGLVLVRQLDATALGIWGLATSLTQFLPLFALGGPMWLYAHSGQVGVKDSTDHRDGRVLSLVLLTTPVVVAFFGFVSWVSGMGVAGAAAFALGCGLLQVTGYQVMRLKVVGRLAAANATLGIDRLVMAVLFPLLAAVLVASPDTLAFSWLLAQVAAFAICLRLLTLPSPRRITSLLEFRSGLYVALALASINSALSLARVPIARLGTDAVGTFVAAGYLALPVLAIGSAIDQLAFFRVSTAKRSGAPRPRDWVRYGYLTIAGAGLAAFVARIVGPPVLAALNDEYQASAGLAGPVLAWSISMCMIGLALKQLVDDTQIGASVRISLAACAVMLVGLTVPILVGASLRRSLQFFAVASLLSSVWVVWRAQGRSIAAPRHVALWIALVVILTLT